NETPSPFPANVPASSLSLPAVRRSPAPKNPRPSAPPEPADPPRMPGAAARPPHESAAKPAETAASLSPTKGQPAKPRTSATVPADIPTQLSSALSEGHTLSPPRKQRTAPRKSNKARGKRKAANFSWLVIAMVLLLLLAIAAAGIVSW